jgi:spore coat protein SA
MKIAFINQPWDRSLPSQEPSPTSISIVTAELASRLAHGNQITVYCPTNKSTLHKVVEKDSEIEYRGIPFTQLTRRLTQPLQRLYDRSNRNPKRPFFSTRIYYYAYAWQVAHDLRAQNFDIIHIHNFVQFVPTIRALNPRAKIVIHMGGDWVSHLDRALIGSVIQQVDLVVGCSDHITQSAAKRFPDYADKCVTVMNGVNLDRFQDAHITARTVRNDPMRLLFVGRISPEKGIHVLIEAFKLVYAKFPHVQLDIVGSVGSAPAEFIVTISDDPKVTKLMEYYAPTAKIDIYYDRLQAMIPPEFKDKINFRGSMPYAQVHEAYRDADLLVNASLSEAFCMPIAEAMATGTPVVAARVGGIPAMVIDGKTGVLVEPGNPRELADAILNLLNDDARRAALSSAAHDHITRSFSWDSSAEVLRKQYERLLQHPRERASVGTPVQSFYLNRLNRRAQEMSADQLKRSAVVFTPHFDDETLGCGGTIIRKKQAGADIKIAFLADGSKSHQGLIPVEQLRTMRETEAVDAAKAMGLRAEDVFCLRFEESILIQQIDKAVARVTELLRQLQPEQVFMPYVGEPPQWSLDHIATTQIVSRALSAYVGKVTIYEYPIWFWYSVPWVSLGNNPRRDQLSILRNSLYSRFGLRFLSDFNCSVDISRVLVQKRSALEQHRSQMFRIIEDVDWPILDDVSGGEFLKCFFHDREIFRSSGQPK